MRTGGAQLATSDTGNLTNRDELAVPDAPRLGAAFRGAAVDFYYNSWRLLPGNLVWGALLLAILVASITWPPALALLALLSFPFAGLSRLAALLARGDAASFADFATGMRRAFWPALVTGIAAVVLAATFTFNIFFGLQVGGPVGWSFSALAFYGDIGLAMVLVAFWPILVDPVREGLPLRRRLWLAVLVNLARPGRMFVLTLLIVALLLVSTVLVAVLLTVAVAYVSLVAARYVLPLADRLEGRPTVHRMS